jgi:hypothetical protein
MDMALDHDASEGKRSATAGVASNRGRQSFDLESRRGRLQKGPLPVRRFNRERAFQREFDDLNEANRLANVYAQKLSSVFFPAIEFLSDKGIRGSYYGSGDAAADLPRLAALALSGELDLAGVVTRIEPLEAVNDALDRLRRGEGARTVLVVDSALAGAPAG